MKLKAEENKELKKLMDWHLEQAAECRSADEVAMRDFHTWAAMLISTVRQTR
jgi:hypothetical protein